MFTRKSRDVFQPVKEGHRDDLGFSAFFPGQDHRLFVTGNCAERGLHLGRKVLQIFRRSICLRQSLPLSDDHSVTIGVRSMRVLARIAGGPYNRPRPRAGGGDPDSISQTGFACGFLVAIQALKYRLRVESGSSFSFDQDNRQHSCSELTDPAAATRPRDGRLPDSYRGGEGRLNFEGSGYF